MRSIGYSNDITLCLCIFMIVTVGLSFISCTRKTPREYPLKPVVFTDVEVKDAFWLPRMETNRRVTIPFAFAKSEETGRIDNFSKAGGLMPAEKIVGGARVRSYSRRGAQTIDCFMALLYAYVALKFQTSGGFTSQDFGNYDGGRNMPMSKKSVALPQMRKGSMVFNRRRMSV